MRFAVIPWVRSRSAKVPNIGRDIGPLLSALRTHLRAGGYDVIGHLHGKRTVEVGGGIGDRGATICSAPCSATTTLTAHLVDLCVESGGRARFCRGPALHRLDQEQALCRTSRRQDDAPPGAAGLSRCSRSARCFGRGPRFSSRSGASTWMRRLSTRAVAVRRLDASRDRAFGACGLRGRRALVVHGASQSSRMVTRIAGAIPRETMPRIRRFTACDASFSARPDFWASSVEFALRPRRRRSGIWAHLGRRQSARRARALDERAFFGSVVSCARRRRSGGRVSSPELLDSGELESCAGRRPDGQRISPRSSCWISVEPPAYAR